MMKTVKVRVIGNSQVREVPFEEAREILERTYDDPLGGMVADARTGEVIWRLSPDVDEILIIEQMIGGG